MLRSIAKTPTASASRYLQQLCKHWEHKLAVQFDAKHGTVAFGEGQSVELSASETCLTVVITSEDEAEIPKLEQVVAVHLKRFAFREDLEFSWTRQTVQPH